MKKTEGKFVSFKIYDFVIDEAPETKEKPKMKTSPSKSTLRSVPLKVEPQSVEDYFSSILNYKQKPPISESKPSLRPYSATKKKLEAKPIRPQSANPFPQSHAAAEKLMNRKIAPKKIEPYPKRNQDDFAFLLEEEEEVPTLTEVIFNRKPSKPKSKPKPNISDSKVTISKFLEPTKTFSRSMSSAQAVLNKNRQKTLEEIRIADKYREKAAKQAKEMMERVDIQRQNRDLIEIKRDNNYKRSEAKLKKEMASLMTKLKVNAQETQEEYQNLKDTVQKTGELLGITQFFKNQTDKKVIELDLSNLYKSETVNYSGWEPTENFKATNTAPEKKEKDSVCLISDDDSFMENIECSSPIEYIDF